MSSREKQSAPHQPLLSSVVVRPSKSGGGGGSSDYEPGEVRLDVPPYSRSKQYPDKHGQPNDFYGKAAKRKCESLLKNSAHEMPPCNPHFDKIRVVKPLGRD